MTPKETLDLLDRVRTKSREDLHLRQLALWQHAESLIADSRKLAAVIEQLRPLIPILRQMQSSGFTPHELQEISAAELLAIIDQPGGEA